MALQADSHERECKACNTCAAECSTILLLDVALGPPVLTDCPLPLVEV